MGASTTGGVCGGLYNGDPRFSAGGQFATGNITSTYTEGSTITIAIQVWTNHVRLIFPSLSRLYQQCVCRVMQLPACVSGPRPSLLFTKSDVQCITCCSHSLTLCNACRCAVALPARHQAEFFIIDD